MTFKHIPAVKPCSRKIAWMLRYGTYPGSLVMANCGISNCIEIDHLFLTKRIIERVPRRLSFDKHLIALPRRRGQGEDDECWEWTGDCHTLLVRDHGNTTVKRALYFEKFGKPQGKFSLQSRQTCHQFCVRPDHHKPRLKLDLKISHTKMVDPELRALLCDYHRDGLTQAPKLARLVAMEENHGQR